MADKRIYLDNAATTKVYPEVVQHMAKVINECYGNPSSIHAEGRKSKTILEDARKSIASNLNASTGEIFFTSGGTESNNMIIYRAIQDLKVERIISSPTEHPSVINVLHEVRKRGLAKVEFLRVDNAGRISIKDLENLLVSDSCTTLVSLMHANNEVGTLNLVQEIGALCKEYKALFHTDATQSLAKYDINVDEMNIHFLGASAHKFHGPKGIGIAYIRTSNMIKPFMFGGGQERNMRSGTENIAAASGMAKAFQIYIDTRIEVRPHIEALRQKLKQRLSEEFGDVHFNGDQGNYLYTVLSVSFPKTLKTDLITFQLDIDGIAASAGSACNSGTEKASYVLSAIDFPDDRKAVRFSFSYENTMDEIDQLINVLHKIILPVKVKA